LAEKLVNFFLDEDKKKKLDIISTRDGISLKDIFTELTDDYIKVHADGNAQFTMDKYQDPDFEAWPAIGANAEKLRSFYMKISKVEFGKIEKKIRQYLDFHNQASDRLSK